MSISRTEEEHLTRAVARINTVMSGLVLGLLLGAGLFIATMALVLQGGPNPGPHLGLLSQYFPGYAVTTVGSFVGLGYGFAVGFVSGLFIGLVYNKLAR